MMINYTTGSTIDFGEHAEDQLEATFEILTGDVYGAVRTAVAKCAKGGTLSITVTVKEVAPC